LVETKISKEDFMDFGGIKRRNLVLLFACLAASWAHIAYAQTNLVTNGSFAVTGGTTSFQFGTYGPYTPTETLAGWASPNGYNYVFLPTSTTATGFYGAFSLWSSTSAGSPNTFNNAGPTGGNFAAADSDYGTQPITQTINNLTPGHTYQLSFAWAGAQQSGFTGATTDSFAVSLGGQTFNTATINLPNEGFSGWMNQTFNYTATSTSEVLSFLAAGAPAVPPFALLANVQLVDAPEPGTLMILLSPIVALAGIARRRSRVRAVVEQPA
jgi:hypothetical protein